MISLIIYSGTALRHCIQTVPCEHNLDTDDHVLFSQQVGILIVIIIFFFLKLCLFYSLNGLSEEKRTERRYEIQWGVLLLWLNAFGLR